MLTYLTIRAAHVLFGAVWVGVAVFRAWWLLPMAKDLGPDAEKVSSSLQRRGYIAAAHAIGMISVLSGLWLYWRYTGGFSTEGSSTHAAMVFGSGGVLAILAIFVEALLVGRSMRRARTMARDAAATASEHDRRRLGAGVEILHDRAVVGSRVAAVLLALTIVLMAVANYL